MATQHRGVKLLRLSDGRHVARWTDPVTRRQVQQSLDLLGLSNVQARRRWAIGKSLDVRALKARIAQGAVSQTRLPVADAQVAYVATIANRNTRKGKAAPLADLAQFLAERGVADVQDIVAPDLHAWADRVRSPSNPRMVSTQNIYLVIASGWLRWCRKRGMVPRLADQDIGDALERQRLPRDPIAVLQPAEVRDLLKSCIAHDQVEPVKVAPFALLLLLTGCRFDEVRDLTWSEVDADAKAIRLPAGRTKTQTARTIDLGVCPVAVDLLKALRLRGGGHGQVFPVLASRTVADSRRYRLMREYDAPQFTWKTLRATCGSLLVCAGIYGGASPFLTAKRLGHSLTVSEKHYLGVFDDLPKDAESIEQAAGIVELAIAIVRSVGLLVATERDSRAVAR